MNCLILKEIPTVENTDICDKKIAGIKVFHGICPKLNKFYIQKCFDFRLEERNSFLKMLS